MGGDGGSVPKRKERVKGPQKEKVADRNPKLKGIDAWKICPLSSHFIRKPVMAGHCGFLFSKEGMLEYLILQSQDALQSYHIREDTPAADQLKTRKDAIELKLVDNPDLDPKDPCWEKGDFVCPITGLETNGQHKFAFSWLCGCVVSERALKECSGIDDGKEKKCLVCEKPYRDFELVFINPEKHKDLIRNQSAFMVRKMEQEGFFKKKDENDSDEPSTSHKSRPSGSRSSNSSKRDRSQHDSPSTSSATKRNK